MSDEFVKGYIGVKTLFDNAQIADQQRQIDSLRNAPHAPATIGLPVVDGKNSREYKMALQQIEKLEGQVRDWANNYNATHLVHAEWILSQKAYKELAQKYGALAGKSVEEIVEEAMAFKVDILENRSQFGNKVEFDDQLVHALRVKLGVAENK